MVIKKFITAIKSSGSTAPFDFYTIPAGCVLEVYIMYVSFSKTGTWNGTYQLKLDNMIIDEQSDGGATTPYTVNYSGSPAPTITPAKHLRLGPGVLTVNITTSTGSITSHSFLIRGLLICNK